MPPYNGSPVLNDRLKLRSLRLVVQDAAASRPCKRVRTEERAARRQTEEQSDDVHPLGIDVYNLKEPRSLRLVV